MTTLALCFTVRPPMASRTAHCAALRPREASLAPAEAGLSTGAVTAASITGGLALASLLRLLIARAAREHGDRPGDVLQPLLGLHGGHPLRAEEGRGQAQRVLLDPDRLHEGHVDLGGLQLL